MKFLCLAYGDEKDWDALPKKEQDALLAQDRALRDRGALIGAVEPELRTVRAWDGVPHTSDYAYATGRAPLAGFSIIEADDFDEAIRMVSGTPCARAHGAIEIHPITLLNAERLAA